MEQFKPFDAFTCVGDTRTVEIGNVRFEARIEFDQDTGPTDFDCYGEEDIQAWRDGEWFYCGIVISAWIDGLCIDDNAASLWGLECNFPGSDNSYLSECANVLLLEAIERAKDAIGKMRKALDSVRI